MNFNEKRRWFEAFERLDEEDTSFSDEAEDLGVHKSTVMRRFHSYLGNGIDKMEKKLEETKNEVCELEEEKEKIQGKIEEIRNLAER